MIDPMIRRRRRLRAATLAALSLTAGLALAQGGAAERRLTALGYVPAEIVEVIPDQIVQSWDYLDDQNVLVHRDDTRHYLVTLPSPCPALQTASTIAFNAAISGISASSTLKVGSSPTAPECRVGGIFRLDRLAPSGKEAPPPKRKPAPPSEASAEPKPLP